MNAIQIDVDSLLAQVGISKHADSELTPGITAQTYTSEYARLYIADCSDKSAHDWSDVVRKVDRKVLQDMRAAELSNGGVIDAHVCFIVSEQEDPTPWVQRNEQLVRQVSRKYWIKSSQAIDDLENRLTLLPIANAPILQQADHVSLSSDDLAWLDRLAEYGPATLSADFLSLLESRI